MTTEPLAAHVRIGKIHAAASDMPRKSLCGVPLDIDATVRAGSRPFSTVGPDYACGRCKRIIEKGAA